MLGTVRTWDLLPRVSHETKGALGLQMTWATKVIERKRRGSQLRVAFELKFYSMPFEVS